ncbi:perforin-1 [Spea bombifrons]|uniref:perforin-1 n=1 Tax=Spea bombifrons TaxID=233779 RepID=UPI00234A0255|nr:perforin-1 [Spea bombifrons]
MLPIFLILAFAPSPNTALHPPLSSSCQTEKEAECRKLPFVPGHNLLGEGLDIVTMKKTRASVLDLEEYMKQKTCTVCKNPHQKMARQKLPQSLVDWKPQYSCSRNIISEVSRSTVSLAEELASSLKNEWQAGLELEHLKANAKLVLAGSQSQLNQFTQQKTSSDRYSFVKQRLRCTYYSFRLRHKPPLSKHFKEALMALPNSYDTNTKSEYQQFIRSFGTHYINQAEVGGEVIDITAVKTCRMAISGVSVDEVKDCLNMESSVTVTGKGAANAMYKACKELSEKATQGDSFHQTFNERTWQVSGGKVTFDLLSSDGKNEGSAAIFEAWMESLKSHPDVVAYSVESVHNLVRFNGPKKENLRKAISEYIMANALRMNCSCPGATYPSHGAKCSCFCLESQNTNSNCCPTKKGLAKLVVTVQQAKGLWGDYTSKTDTYVKIGFGRAEVIAPTVWNNDNPTWNLRFDMGTVEINALSNLRVEVWDEDNKYDDDLLGKCNKPLTSGEAAHVCYLQHGHLNYKVSVTCAPHLSGPLCQDYAAARDWNT